MGSRPSKEARGDCPLPAAALFAAGQPDGGQGQARGTVAAVHTRLAAGESAVTRMQGADGAEAADLARQAVEERYDVLAVMGGDGMVHLAAEALAGSATVLGVIATGTGNDVARYLGLPRASRWMPPT